MSWSLDFNRLKEIASRYPTPELLKESDPIGYEAIRVNGLLKRFYPSKCQPAATMTETVPVQPDEYTLEKVRLTARQYLSCSAFKRGAPKEYGVARERDWLHRLSFLGKSRGAPEQWTYEKVAVLAKQYSSPTALNQNAPDAYQAAARNDWLKSLVFGGGR